MSEYISDIQYTPGMDLGVLVREINRRNRQVNRNFLGVKQALLILEFLATTRTYTVSYANNRDIDVFTSSLDVVITDMAFRSPGSVMDVVPRIDRGGVKTPILFNPDVPGSLLNVTDTAQKVEALALISGGNSDMTKNDIFQVSTSNGSQGDPLNITVKFYIIGLSEDPVTRILQLINAVQSL